MKRVGYLYHKIYDRDNIETALKNAAKNNKNKDMVNYYKDNSEKYITEIQRMLMEQSYVPSKYVSKTIVDKGKTRVIHKTRFFPDRIIHHALIQVIFPTIESVLITDTYQSLPNRGCHLGVKKVNNWIKADPLNCKYVAKLDIVKFYPNVDNEILKQLFRKKFKDPSVLWLLDTVIDSIDGLPIGNYTSQIFGNYYLAFFDHYAKEDLRIKNYIRYADDIVFFSNCKKHLQGLVNGLKNYLKTLKLSLGKSSQVFPLKHRPLDYLGYVFYINGSLKIRRRIKRNFIRCSRIKVLSLRDMQRLTSLLAWLMHADSWKLIRRYLTDVVRSKLRRTCNVHKTSIPKNIGIFI